MARVMAPGMLAKAPRASADPRACTRLRSRRRARKAPMGTGASRTASDEALAHQEEPSATKPSMDRRLPASMAAVASRAPVVNTRKSAKGARTRPSMTRVVRILSTEGEGFQNQATSSQHKQTYA
eukprot:3976346-Lingulodinium_polyedra.AAC.1